MNLEAKLNLATCCRKAPTVGCSESDRKHQPSFSTYRRCNTKPIPKWDVHFGGIDDDRKDATALHITFRPQLSEHRQCGLSICTFHLGFSLGGVYLGGHDVPAHRRPDIPGGIRMVCQEPSSPVPHYTGVAYTDIGLLPTDVGQLYGERTGIA